jgi:hypothetical protein
MYKDCEERMIGAGGLFVILGHIDTIARLNHDL